MNTYTWAKCFTSTSVIYIPVIICCSCFTEDSPSVHLLSVYSEFIEAVIINDFFSWIVKFYRIWTILVWFIVMKPPWRTSKYDYDTATKYNIATNIYLGWNAYRFSSHPFRFIPKGKSRKVFGKRIIITWAILMLSMDDRFKISEENSMYHNHVPELAHLKLKCWVVL